MFATYLYFLLVPVMLISAEQCTTPNKETAQCVSLYSCPVLISALATQHPISIEFVRLSNCGGNGTNPLVCCGTSSNFTESLEITTTTHHKDTSVSLLADKRYCGYQHSDDYFRNDNKTTEISEFPWIALLLYKDNENQSWPSIRCTGSLINARYVLTAAHCISQSKNVNLFTLTAVELGDFNIKNQTDCVNTTGIEECSAPVERFKIEKVVFHPNYTEDFSKYDIALIRLDRTVIYSDYIRPVCLPFPGTKYAQIGDILYTTGWGGASAEAPFAVIKKKVKSRLISKRNCNSTYLGMITKNHFCTIDEEDNKEFGCSGDTGGPVLFSYRNQWYQEGIIHYISIFCGDFPVLHLKVRKYMNWIENNIEPFF